MKELEALRELKKIRGLKNDYKFAKHIGISPSYLSKIWKGERRVPVWTVAKNDVGILILCMDK